MLLKSNYTSDLRYIVIRYCRYLRPSVRMRVDDYAHCLCFSPKHPDSATAIIKHYRFALPVSASNCSRSLLIIRAHSVWRSYVLQNLRINKRFNIPCKARRRYNFRSNQPYRACIQLFCTVKIYFDMYRLPINEHRQGCAGKINSERLQFCAETGGAKRKRLFFAVAPSRCFSVKQRQWA